MKTNKVLVGRSGRKSPDEKRSDLREKIWPGSESWVWDRKSEKGFVTVPRLLPWVCHLLKILTKGSKNGDPSPVYVELWCRSYDQGLVTIKDEEECAFAAGYSSSRAFRTWSAHMTTLVDLGFILTSRDGMREFGQVLLLHPLAVVAGLRKAGRVPENWWTSFASRACEVGAAIPEPLQFPKDLTKMK